MEKEIIKFGITSLDEYPSNIYKNYYKQLIENDILCMPCEKPDMRFIDNISVTVCVNNLKIINTILGYKLIIEAVKNYKIMYTANNDIQSVHTTIFESCFCEFILLENCSSNNKILNIKEVFIGIEDIIIKSYDYRNIDISLVLILYPIVFLSDRCTCNH